MSLKYLIFVGLILFVVAEKNPYKSIVSHLHDYSSVTGGFSLDQKEAPSLEATYYALLLSSLFGTRQQLVKHVDVTPFVETLQNGDHGYGGRPGVASDLESVRQAVFSYSLLGYAVPDSEKVASYVRSLIQSDGLFSSGVGEDSSVQSTAYGLQVLDLVKQLDSVKSKFSTLEAFLKSKVSGSRFNFDSDEDFELTDNYFGLVVASYVNFKVASPKDWASQILGKQQTDGGFGSPLETLNAIASLRLLSTFGKENFVSKVNTESLLKYAQTASAKLDDLANVHLAVALAGKFASNFHTSVSYESASSEVKETIVQGSKLKPVLSVKNTNDLPHTGLEVEVTVSHKGSQRFESDLQYSESAKHYISEESFDTTGYLGPFSFSFAASANVPGYGKVAFTVQDTKNVGFGIVVDSEAIPDITGKEVQEGDVVPPGTNFKFAVKLHNTTVHELSTGDFTVTLRVKDSSSVTIHSEAKDRSKTSDALSYQYSLKTSSIPAGALSFVFEVANSAGVHTTHVVKYLFNVPMVATQITFDGVASGAAPTYKFGDKVKATVVPANYPDLRSLASLEDKDASGKSVADTRKFFLDISTPQGLVLESVRGSAQKGSKYLFEFSVPATLDFVGNFLIAFRYEPTEGNSVQLSNFDSALGELFSEAFHLNFTVNAQLVITNLDNKSFKTQLFYGNEVQFSFQVQDALTKKSVSAGAIEKATVNLVLQHQDEDRPKVFTTVSQPATQNNNVFSVSYSVNPNAIQGAGVLALVAHNADGQEVPLYSDASGKSQVKYNINIGGEINVDSKVHTQASYVSPKLVGTLFHETSYVVQFTLNSQGKLLKDAVLKCNVSTRGAFSASDSLFTVPVASNSEGVYSTSWVLPRDQPSTDFLLQCYREVDRLRAVEAKEFKEKRKRKEREARGESTADLTEESLTLTPFFEITVRHDADDGFQLPLRTEILFTSLLAAAFVGVYYKMSTYTTTSSR